MAAQPRKPARSGTGAGPRTGGRKAATKAVATSAKRAVKPSVKRAAPAPAKRAAAAPARTGAEPRQRKAYKAVLKTTKTEASVAGFLAGLPDPQQRADAQVLASIFAKVTGQPAKMWGSAIVGYGDYSYVGRSGRSGDWFLGGFSPRKGTLTLYALGGWAQHPELLARLGSHRLGGGCLYLRRLDGIDMKALHALVAAGLARAKAIAPTMMDQRDR